MLNLRTCFKIKEEVSSPRLPTRWAALASPSVARAAAYADIDNDGFLDVLMTTNAGPACFSIQRGRTNHSSAALS